MLCLQINKLKSPFLCVCDSIKVVLLFFKPPPPVSTAEITGETSFNCFHWGSFEAVIFWNLKKKGFQALQGPKAKTINYQAYLSVVGRSLAQPNFKGMIKAQSF